MVLTLFLRTSLNHQHRKIRDKVGPQKDFVLHSFRHSMLTDQAKPGLRRSAIMRIAGHCSIGVSKRYLHPSAEGFERAFERLETFNQAAVVIKNDNDQRPATVSATPEDLIPVGSSGNSSD